MLGKPIISKMNNGLTAVIIGNGYNSTSGKAVLYVFNLTTGQLIKKLDTQISGDNGLASPGVFDQDNDGDIDVIYAGDLKGNIWKFDVGDADATNWDIAFDTNGTPEPFFTAKNSSNIAQPITAQISIAVNDQTNDINVGKRFVFFGTGSYIQAGDPNSSEIQSWYGLIDEGTQISDRTTLAQRAILSEGTFGGSLVRTFDEASENDMNGKSGWYIDFNTQAGERIITSSKIYNLFKPVLIASSIIPIVNDPCVPGGKGFINTIDPFTGARLGTGIIDVNNNSSFDDDKYDDIFISSIDVNVAMPSEPVLINDRLVVGGTSSEIASVKVKLGSNTHGRRLSWRELLN
jgi:type IV pilus assembly protein PilY1